MNRRLMFGDDPCANIDHLLGRKSFINKLWEFVDRDLSSGFNFIIRLFQDFFLGNFVNLVLRCIHTLSSVTYLLRNLCSRFKNFVSGSKNFEVFTRCGHYRVVTGKIRQSKTWFLIFHYIFNHVVWAQFLFRLSIFRVPFGQTINYWPKFLTSTITVVD